MPTYGYRCPACRHEYDKLQKISDATRIKCPRCGKRGERLISGGAGIVFKGSGFYETDYKRAGARSEKEQSEAAKGGASSDSSEKKPSDTKKRESTKKQGDGP